MKTEQHPHANADDCCGNPTEEAGCINLTTSAATSCSANHKEGEDETDLINSSSSSVDNTSTASVTSNRRPAACAATYLKATVVSIIVKPQKELLNRQFP